MVMACSAAGRAERRNVSLNIKNAETYQLVQELVALTGETQTAAVTIAVRERLDRLRHLREADLTDRLLAIGAYTAPRLRRELAVDRGRRRRQPGPGRQPPL
jgi:hypothetical protein